jgi:glutaredoxin 3
MAKDTIYSTPTCTYCELAKQFFTEKGVQYEDFNVAADSTKLQEMLEISGQMGVPVIKIDDSVVVGFDQGTISGILGL